MSLDVRNLMHPTVLLAIALLAVITMMILPMPSWILDLGLTASFGLAILVFTVTLFINRPLEFSAFPSILLGALVLRLALNVASTKLIIGDGHNGTHAAGGVIEGFAMFVMGGSILIGLVVFTVLLIVNFVVITKGAGRMAEVAARFALDGMPGRQLAIDSDIAAGAIGHAEARERRRLEQEETTFFGSLDGASKFVRGDAVAGLLITLLNLVMGLVIGIFSHGLAPGEAFETYAILTVGDGLVSQIPAVIISIATALLLSKGAEEGSADRAILAQLGAHPHALATVSGLLALLAFVPGLPVLPFLVGAAVLGAAAWLARGPEVEDAPEAEAAPPTATLGDSLDLDEIHMSFAPNLVPTVMDDASGLGGRISNMRHHVAVTYGLILPEVRLTDDPGLDPGGYAIRIHGVEMARDRVVTDRVLALLPQEGTAAPEGEDVSEPVYGAPARWIASAKREAAVLTGLSVVTPNEVIATHLLETIKSNFGRIFSRRTLRALLDAFTDVSDPARAEANRRVLDEFVPERVPLDLLQSVLRLLLEERVSIRNLPLILEAIAEVHPSVRAPEAICEHVRQRLGFQLVADVQEPDGTVPLITLATRWEELFERHQVEGGADLALPTEDFARLGAAVSEALQKADSAGRAAAVVTTAKRRRFLRTVLTAKSIRAPVLSFDELGAEARLALVATAA